MCCIYPVYGPGLIEILFRRAREGGHCLVRARTSVDGGRPVFEMDLSVKLSYLSAETDPEYECQTSDCSEHRAFGVGPRDEHPERKEPKVHATDHAVERQSDLKNSAETLDDED